MSPHLKQIFISLPVQNLPASIAFYQALGFELNPQFSDAEGACMVWSETIHTMLLSHSKWRSFTELPLPPADTAGHMLNLSLPSREAVDAMNEVARSQGGRADVNPVQDLGFMYARDQADPDGHLWGVFWMNPEGTPEAEARSAS